MPWEDYVEKELISKRSCMAGALLAMFGYAVLTGNSAGVTALAGLVGSVIGFYFKDKAQPAEAEG